MKEYKLWPKIGKTKYPVTKHDGISTNKDGSPFWDIACFNNKKKCQAYINDLKRQGYQECRA